MQSANAYKLKIGEKRFSAVFYRSPSIVKTRSCLVFTWRARRSMMANTTWLKLVIIDAYL